MKRGKKNTKERIEAIYARLPGVECQGRCWTACGPIAMTQIEMKRLTDAGGIGGVTTREDGFCGALDRKARRCTRYSVRPLICRLYGVAEGLRCPYGCRTERVLTDEEAREFQVEIMALSEELAPNKSEPLLTIDTETLTLNAARHALRSKTP